MRTIGFATYLANTLTLSHILNLLSTHCKEFWLHSMGYVIYYIQIDKAY